MIFFKRSLSLLFIFSFLTFAQVPISDLKINDSSGDPVGLGQTFTISGIVTASNQFGNNGPGNIQDSTAGISVYGSAFISGVNIGDSVTLTGKLDQFNGLTQINLTLGGASVTNHGAGTTPEPQVVTIQQILNQQWNGFEEYESKLIRINNATISGTGNFSGGSSGTNYNITDPTGTMEIRIDESVDLVSTPIPTGAVDIIGVLGQFDNSVPRSTGYQLYPRFISDLVYESLPIILLPVTAANIDSTSFTVFYSTANNGNTQVKYGLTSALELGNIVINEDTTFHRVDIGGLQSGTLYYYKAYSTNSVGTSESDLRTVFTTSNDTTTGTINVYFNFSVDTTVALPGNHANGNINFVEKLVHRINNANHSIDLALYSFDLSEIANALVLAKNRGVKVRVVYDSRNTQPSMQTLISNGILISKRPPESSTFRGIMHNKFFVFDVRDTIPNNDWVWTGSWNVTDLETGWKNNVVEINDPSLASAYLLEFEEMWGSNTDTPNPANAKFSSFKTDNTPHTFTVGGREINSFFSPSDGTTSQIINTVNEINYSMYFSIFTFTRSDINSAMFTKYNSGVTDIRGIIDQTGDPSSQWNSLNNYADMFSNSGVTLHHKYALFDPNYAGTDPTVITGSHNWSNAAENNNDENTLIIYDHLIANQYLQEFKKRYNESGGTGVFIIPELVPVELTSFSAAVENRIVKLKWSTATETNNSGFYVEKSFDKNNWLSLGFIEGNGTTTETINYSFNDSMYMNLVQYYRLKQVDFDGTFEYSKIVEINSHLTEFSFQLYQNYPNPFNPITTIRFEIPYEQNVELKIFDMLGREVRTLYNDLAPAGIMAVDFKADDLASGTYIYRLKTDNHVISKKLILIK